MLTFEIFDPRLEIKSSSAQDGGDIADVMAGAVSDKLSLRDLYLSAFGSVKRGIQSFSKSIDRIRIGQGIEFAWNTRLSGSYLARSGLTAELDSLRSLKEVPITEDMLAFDSVR